ncbi:MAG: bifunctional 2-C-methyl-D-erythritol 4-phosphate cytidylyltransferase/2-C-methyl-D-erythritol 2,4-cyclodiphosphate synthase [Pseudomonadota bacterium]
MTQMACPMRNASAEASMIKMPPKLTETPLNIGVVVVAAGRGSRASGYAPGPKQYFRLAEKSILERTLSALISALSASKASIVPVIHADDEALYRDSVAEDIREQVMEPTFGGATRQASVLCGLDALAETSPDIVLIHDAARPFVSEALVQSLVDVASDGHASLPLVAVHDTVKRVENGVVLGTIDRSQLGLAQTPQAFPFQIILNLHRKAAALPQTFTDDIAIAEHFGLPVRAVQGDAANAKLTTAEDLQKAQAMMSPNLPDVRVGTAYDVHRSEPGTEITLCGITIPSPVSLIGHSDADVALHALTDAVLGGLADGDIGSHFPPTDPQWRGAASDQFLIHAMKLAEARGARVTMLDVTIICEAPKIGPHRDAMRESVAAIADLPLERVAVKATTNETIGFIGRQEGIAAIASATLVFGAK